MSPDFHVVVICCHRVAFPVKMILMDAGQMIGLTGCHCHAGPGPAHHGEASGQLRELIGNLVLGI